MTPQRVASRSFPVEDFLQALTAQLDRAQDALALKVSGTHRPLTWALKDLSIDLRVFVEVNDSGKVLLRSAGVNEDGASTIHLSLTTITRPMVEENSWSFHEDSDPRSIEEIRSASNLDADDQRKLDWMGVRTVGQLRQLNPMAVQAVVGIPVTRLQAALEAAARPTLYGQEVLRQRDGTALLRIIGANLAEDGPPTVHLDGRPVEVLEVTPRHVVVRPDAMHRNGEMEIVAAGQRLCGRFDLGTPPASVSTNGGVP